MVYVRRDEHGRLLRVEDEPFEGMSGTLTVQSDEMNIWLRHCGDMQSRRDLLRESDRDVLRIMEDVVSLLIERGVIDYGELPQAARDKLDLRALIRADLEGLVDQS